MQLTVRKSFAVFCIAASFAVLGIRAQQDSTPASPKPTNAKPIDIDARVLRSAGSANDPLGGSWLSYGKTQAETRFSPLKQIDTSNVARLGLAWSYVVGAGGGNQEGTPLVWDNTLYGITSWSVVYALDAITGKQLWRWDPEVNQTAVRPKICCGVVNRGVAIYNGMIIAPAIDGRLFALDALTGKPIWETRVAYPQDQYTITMAPRIAGDKVVIGVSGGDRPTRGFFDAYDAVTGKRAWRFYTVPGDPSKGFENKAMEVASKTWSTVYDYRWGGGGAVWDGFAYDPEANLVYVGTGNAEPWVQKFRGMRDMDSLYTCSILAVDLTSGQLKWHYQTVPNDNWDYDSVQHLMLLDLKINGRDRKVITQAAKNGFFYVLDRVTGEFISGKPYTQVNWTSGLDAKGRPIVNADAYYDADPISIYPTGGGGHNWSPMSYNPATGFVYIPSWYGPMTYAATESLDVTKGGTGYTRGKGDPKPNTLPFIGPEPPEPGPGLHGVLQAWDPVNQKYAWRALGGGGIGGGSVSTAGNLVFQVINDGRFRAYSADKGEKLYDIQIGRTGMAPPITYEAGGTQYVAFMGGLGRAATVVGPNDAKIDAPPMLFVFALEGKAPLPPPAPAPVKAAPPKPTPLADTPAPELQNN